LRGVKEGEGTTIGPRDRKNRGKKKKKQIPSERGPKKENEARQKKIRAGKKENPTEQGKKRGKNNRKTQKHSKKKNRQHL